MKLLHILPSADPRGGGPMEGVRQRGLRLLEMGHSVDLLTLDDPQAPWLSKHPLTIHAIGPTTGRYRYNAKLVPWLHANAVKYDMVVINGLWQYHSYGSWRALRDLSLPYVVFTHGMLDPWFKRTYPLKHLKKWLYWPWSEYRVLRDAAAVLFTSEDERRLARDSFWLYQAREQVVSYGTRSPPDNRAELAERFLQEHPTLRNQRLLLFLGRIQEKKGCDLLIDAFADVVNQPGSDGRLQLVIAGPDQDGWVPALKAQAENRGVAHRIFWPGMLQADAKWGAFYAAEAFLLPSHQENFGIAVAEALGCGLPVLISDKVNIWREVEADAAGFVAPDNVAGTRDTLQRWLALDESARLLMSQRARQSFEARYTVEAMADSLLSVIADLQQSRVKISSLPSVFPDNL